MSLHPGSRVGPYEVVAPLGVGGMGEVYRARDTRLKREVALKILPPFFASDSDRLARFEREAQALAALNHPNIASIYGIEQGGEQGHALVLELVEGDTLAERIARGPMPVDDVLAIARQMSDALEAAHEHGIVHRDLKPANVKITPDGVVKILDFGLAKLDSPDGGTTASTGGSSLSMSPTMTSPAMVTGAGMLLGTAAYMAPEQARGKGADKRADIWAFGVVVFEMLTGARAFEGETVTETAGAVIHKDVDWKALSATTPPIVRTVLKRCLQKDPKQRVRDMGDVRLALAGAFVPEDRLPAEAGGYKTDLPAKAGSYTMWLPPSGGRAIIGAALIAGLLTGAGAWMFTRSEAPSRSLLRFDVPPPAPNAGAAFAMVSPDGRSFAFFALEGEEPRLWVHSFDSGTSRVLSHAGNLGGLGPYWSPDGRSLVFSADRKLKKVAVAGGPVETLCDLETGNFLGAAWGPNGIIVFADGSKGIMQVSANGGSPTQVTAVDRERGETNHATPSFLPDGRHFLYNRLSRDASFRGVYVGALDTKPDAQDLMQLVSTEQTHAYAPSDGSGTGHLLTLRDGLLMAQPFDEGRRVLAGEAVPIAEQVWVLQNVIASFSVSTNGTLVYRRGSSGGSTLWVDRSGKELGTIGAPNLQDPRNPRLSPDGRSLALVVAGDVWRYDLEGRPPVKLTFEGGRFSPVWTRDGTRLVYEGSGSLWETPADGSGTARKVAPAGHYHPHAWAANGELIALRITEPGNIMDLVQFAPQETAEPTAIVATPASEGFTASLSPDGRWLAYGSDQTGRVEIWVRPHPGPGAAIRISPNGGTEPLWAKDGRELYYLEFNKMMAVAVDTAGGFNFKPPTMLFESRYAHGEQPPTFDVAADGRFVMIKSDASPNEPTRVIVNWTELLRRRNTE